MRAVINIIRRQLTHKRLLRLSILLAAAGAVFAVYAMFNPESTPWMPQCIFHRLTGFDCPGCGSQRFLHSLLHADFISAARANALLIPLTPYLAFWIWIELDPSTSPRLHRNLNSPIATSILLTIIILWAILRNIAL